jgi:hypothetical protein
MPEQAPADSAPGQSPWPWAEEAGDLFTPRKQRTPAGGENHDTPPSPGREALQALQAEAHANQPAPPPPRRWTFPLSPQSLVTAGCVALAVVGGVVAALMVVFHTTSTPTPPSPAAPPQPPATSNPAVPTAAAVSSNPVTIPTPIAVTPTPALPPPNPAADNTNTAAVTGPGPQPPRQTVTSRRSPIGHPAPAPVPQTPAPQPNRPQWAGGDAQSTPDTPPCTTDCAQPTLTRSPTHWSPDSP